MLSFRVLPDIKKAQHKTINQPGPVLVAANKQPEKKFFLVLLCSLTLISTGPVDLWFYCGFMSWCALAVVRN